MTSSPGPIPWARRAATRATVPLLTAIACATSWGLGERIFQLRNPCASGQVPRPQHLHHRRLFLAPSHDLGQLNP